MKILSWVALAAVAFQGGSVALADTLKFIPSKVEGLPNFSNPALGDETSPLAAADPEPLTFDYSFSINKPIPDNDPSGIVDHRDIFGVGYIQKIEVTLQVSGGSNGDYYFYLEHDGAVAVLLNRVGKSAAMPEGYNDPGLNVTFSDAAANGDIHIYRVTITGNDTTALGGPLDSQLGDSLWQPDGRNTSPFDVTTDSPRNATLSAFHDHLLNGGWTLFGADVNQGQAGVLIGWNMQVIVVPEPTTIALFSSSLVLALIVRHGIKRSV